MSGSTSPGAVTHVVMIRMSFGRGTRELAPVLLLTFSGAMERWWYTKRIHTRRRSATPTRATGRTGLRAGRPPGNRWDDEKTLMTRAYPLVAPLSMFLVPFFFCERRGRGGEIKSIMGVNHACCTHSRSDCMLLLKN